jgi:hypothetical protein
VCIYSKVPEKKLALASEQKMEAYVVVSPKSWQIPTGLHTVISQENTGDRSSLHHRVEHVSDTKLDNITRISCKVFGVTRSLLDYGYGLSCQSAFLKAVYISFQDRLIWFHIYISQDRVVNNACYM